MLRSRPLPRTAIVTRAPALARFIDRLSGGVTRSDHDHVVAAALRGLASPRPVVDATFEQFVDVWKLEPPPDHPGGGEDHMRGQLVAAGEGESLVAVRGDRTADDAALQDELGAKALRLATCQPGELGAADAVDEPEEVLDQRGVRRLATGHVRLDQQGGQPVGCGVHGSGETSWSGSDDPQVVVRSRRWGREAPGLGERGDCHGGDHVVAIDQCRRLDAGRCTTVPEQRIGLRRPFLDQLVWLRDAREEVTHAMRRGVQARPYELDGWPDGAHSFR